MSQKILYYGLNMSTVLFVFISGFLFQYTNSKTFQYHSYLLKKLKYVVVPYIIISIPALVDKIFFEGDAVWMAGSYKNSNIFFQVIYMLVTGKHSGPFYFIPMICVVYLLAPAFHALQKTRSFFYTGLIIMLLGLFSHHYGYYASMAESLFFFVPVYVFGIWVSRHQALIIEMPSYLFWTLAIVYAFLFGVEVSEVVSTYRLENFGELELWSNQLNWGKAKEIILAVLLLRLFYKYRQLKIVTLYTLGSYSFGIYFIHIYFINTIEMSLRYLGVQINQNLFVFIVYALIILLLSTMTVYLIKKISLEKSRYFIGS